jgi:ComF family protein
VGAGWRGIGSLFSKGLDVLFPQLCLFCRGEWVGRGLLLCEPCRDAIVWIQYPYCFRCGVPADVGYDFPHEEFECAVCRKGRYQFDRARSLGIYDSVLKELIHHFKYQKRLGVMEELRPLLVKHFSGLEEVYAGFEVAPIPLHVRRLNERGFDQAYLLAREVARILRLPLTDGVLVRERDTPSQAGKHRQERAKNIRDAFAVVQAESVAGKNILLVDDVMTTGATLDAATQALKKAGARRVDVFTLARA